jgi:GAF domain-containing protein
MHPAARAVGGARSRDRAAASTPGVAAAHASDPAAPAEGQPAAPAEVLGVTSLARALGGEAHLSDVGALVWMMIQQVLPCSSMGLFVPDVEHDLVVGGYAAGPHAALIRGLETCPGDGMVGWVAGHRLPAVNAEPALDFGPAVATLQPSLLATLAVPLVHDGQLVAVLAVYASTRHAFSEDHARLLDLLAPKLAASIAAVSARSKNAFLSPPASLHYQPRTASRQRAKTA